MNFQETVLVVCQVAISEVLKVCPQEEKHHAALEDRPWSPGVIYQ